MKFKTQAEIFQALLDGACISHISWVSGYVSLENGSIVDSKGDKFNLDLRNPPEWVKVEKAYAP